MSWVPPEAQPPPDGEHGLTVRLATPDDAAWIAGLLTERWGTTVVVSRGRAHDAAVLPGVVAERDGERVGLATWRIEGPEAELVTIDAVIEGEGVGGALLRTVASTVAAVGCRRLWLITTNDNLRAIRFYQRRGMRLVAVHRGAVDEARRIKPQISEVGKHGIPLHDELEFELELPGLSSTHPERDDLERA
jgi:N-acetylglutamate synthase-like GNAT family acetyltransferase